MPTNPEWTRVVVGRIGRPHGVRGELTVEVRTDEPEARFAPGAKLFFQIAPEREPLEVVSTRWQGNYLLLTVEGVTDRTAAEELRDFLVESQVRTSDVPAAVDEYYDRQLIGLDAVADDQVVGEIADVLHLPGQEVLVLRRADGSEVMVPFVSAIVPEVDLLAGRITLNPPPGLLDEAAAEVVRDAD